MNLHGESCLLVAQQQPELVHGLMSDTHRVHLTSSVNAHVRVELEHRQLQTRVITSQRGIAKSKRLPDYCRAILQPECGTACEIEACQAKLL